MMECEMMGTLPKPRLKVDRAEQLQDLPIIRVSARDCDYHEDNTN